MVLDAASGNRLEALAVLVLAIGMRQGEALSLRWSDVDLRSGTVKVTESKTDAGRRTVALPPFATAALRAHTARQKQELMAAPYWDDPSLVFSSSIGTKLDRRNVLRWWHDLTVRAGVGRRRFHVSRHTAATLMLNNGVPLEVVSSTLGHSGLAITADVYARVGAELQRQLTQWRAYWVRTTKPSPASREQSAEGGEQRTVGGLVAGPADAAPEDSHFVAQSKQLDLLGGVRPTEEHHRSEHISERHVHEGPQLAAR